MAYELDVTYFKPLKFMVQKEGIRDLEKALLIN